MTRRSRIALLIAAVILIPVLACGAAALIFIHKFYPSPPTPHFPPPRNTAMAQMQDLDYFRNYLTLNRSYTNDARARAVQLLDEYRRRAGSLSSAQFDLAIAHLVALADNGHSRINPGPLSRHHNRLPCRLYRFDDGYWVIRARPACRQALGMKIVAIDGHPVDEVANQMYQYFGGPKNHYYQSVAAYFLESPDLLNAAGIASAPDRLTLRVASSDGGEHDEDITAEPPDEQAPHVDSDQFLSPAAFEGEPADWTPFLPATAELPIFFSNYELPFNFEYWAKERVAYAQFRSNENEPGHPISAFVKSVRSKVALDQPRDLIVDLRLDQGGDFTTTASLMKDLTHLASSIDHVYILTSAWTFSAGDVDVALAKEHGGRKITVVGQGVGDRTRIWAEGGNMTLPNSKLSVRFATGLHDYTHPCTGEDGCFWVMYFFQTHVDNLQPDVYVPYNFDDYSHLRDPVLSRVLSLRTSDPNTRFFPDHFSRAARASIFAR
jgi:hypothetical protein